MSLQAKHVVTITLVGDEVGKSCLLISYIENKFPNYSNVPTVFENYGKCITIHGQKHYLTLNDTHDHADYARLRSISYQNTTCFLICYSVSNRASYENVTTKWIPEIRYSNPNTPIVLVATKIDLRNDSNQETITKKEGKKLMRRIKANSYVECSAKNLINVVEVFKEAVRVSTAARAPHESRSCVLL